MRLSYSSHKDLCTSSHRSCHPRWDTDAYRSIVLKWFSLHCPIHFLDHQEECRLDAVSWVLELTPALWWKAGRVGHPLGCLRSLLAVPFPVLDYIINSSLSWSTSTSLDAYVHNELVSEPSSDGYVSHSEAWLLITICNVPDIAVRLPAIHFLFDMGHPMKRQCYNYRSPLC